MPAAKRTSGASAAAAAPAAKKPRAAKVAGLAEVAAALRAAGPALALPPAAVETALAALPLSLAVPKDERHRFQEEMVGEVEGLLQQRKTFLEGEVAAATAGAARAQETSKEKEAGVAAAQGEHDGRRKAAQEAKVGLAGVARGFQGAKKALAEAELAAARGQRELAAAGRQKEEVEALVREAETLHETKDIAGFVQRLGKQLPEVDDSLKTAIPCSFSKEPAARGNFDVMVIKQVSDKLAQRIADLQTTLDNGEGDAAARGAAVDKAKAALDQAKAEQIESAQSYTVAADAAAAASEGLAGARKEFAAAAKLQRDTAGDVTDAQVALDIFVQEPLDLFQKLRDRLAPVEAPAEEPAAAAAAGSPEKPQEHAGAEEELKEPERLAASPAPEPVAVA